jgi:hypothetical protein
VSIPTLGPIYSFVFTGHLVSFCESRDSVYLDYDTELLSSRNHTFRREVISVPMFKYRQAQVNPMQRKMQKERNSHLHRCHNLKTCK